MRSIILDCDPGHDDAVAIMLAAKNNQLNLLGITIVAGNQTIDKTARNALKVCQHLDIDCEVYQGSAVPLVREKQEIAENIHGESGLDGPVFDKLIRKINEKHALEFIIETILNHTSKVTIIATGPLTNIALALKINPKIKDNIEEIVIMGGSYQHGNLTPAAEFNIWADPESAQIVFTSNIPITMIGLDVTRKVLVTSQVLEKMAKVQTKASELFVDLMLYFNKTQKEVFGWEGGPLHDPLTVAYVIDPSVVKTKLMNVEIDTWSVQSYGRTNCDVFGLSDKCKNAYVALSVDNNKYWDILERHLKSYD